MLEKQIYLSARSIHRKDNKVFFFDVECNTLFTYDLYDDSIEVVDAFLEYQKEPCAIFGDYIIENNDKLFFVPFYSNMIGIYDTRTNEDQTVFISELEKKYRTSYFTTNKVVVYKDKMWMFSSNPLIGVYVLDMNTYMVKKDIILSKKLEDCPIVCKLEVVNGSFFYAGVSDHDSILRIDVEQREVKEIKIPVPNGKIFMFGEDGTNVWFVLRNSTDVYEWDTEENITQKYRIEGTLWDKDEKHNMQPYVKFVFVDHEAYILGFDIQAIMKINRENGMIEKAFDFPEGFIFLEGKKNQDFNAAFWSVERIDDKLFFFPSGGNMLLIYDVKSGLVEGKELTIEKEKIPNYKKLITNKLIDMSVRDEMDSFFSLYDCLEYEQDKCNLKREIKESVGQQIWRKLNDE